MCVCFVLGGGGREGRRAVITLTNNFLGLVNGTLLALQDIIAYLLVMTSSSLMTSFFSKKLSRKVHCGVFAQKYKCNVNLQCCSETSKMADFCTKMHLQNAFKRRKDKRRIEIFMS